MTVGDFFSIAGSILLSLGGGAIIVAALAKWLGGVWASRILESERASHAQELEILVRRRNIYANLATTLRVFLKPHDAKASDGREKFLAAYDEASLWAPDAVMNAVGSLLDLVKRNTAALGSVPQEDLQAAYELCIIEMRRDSGFPNTSYKYRIVSF